MMTVIFSLISFKYLSDPVGSAAAAGINFTSPGGIDEMVRSRLVEILPAPRPHLEVKNYTAFKDRMLERPAVQRVVEDEKVKV